MANHYIRDGASGDGSDWTNAWDDLPTTFVRGDTYYVADGTYGAHTFSTAVSGTDVITIKKATASDHGTETGWDSGYGDGEALFTESASSIWVITSSYWDFDGVVGSGISGHGIRVYQPSTAANTYTISIPYGSTAQHVTVSHVNINAGGYDGSSGVTGFYAIGEASYLTLEYCYIHDYGQRGAFLRGPQHCVVQYCYFQNGGSGNAAMHSIGLRIDAYYSSTDFTFRYNTMENLLQVGGSGYLGLGTDADLWGQVTETSDFYVYGNVFWSSLDDEGPGSFVIGNYSGDTTNNVKIYNNTMYSLNNAADFWFSAGTGNVAYNNLWYGCYQKTGLFTNCSHDYNACDADLGETHDQLLSSDPFTDAANGDFSLVAETDAGTTLLSPYNVDMLGTTRGADGTWDRGAIEYSEGFATPVLDASRYYWRIRCKDSSGRISSWSPTNENYFQTILACTGSIEIPSPTVSGSTSGTPTNWNVPGGITLPAVTVAGAARLGHNATGAIVLGTVEVDGSSLYKIVWCSGAITLSPVAVRGSGPDAYGKGKSQQYVQWRLASRRWRGR